MIAAPDQTNRIGTRLLRTRWLAVSTFCTLGFALLLTIAGGCGPSERQRVQTVSDQFLDAMAQEDWTRAKPLLTEKARDTMGNLNPFGEGSETTDEKRVSESPKVENYTVGEPNIEDAAASVPVTLTRNERSASGMLRLRREDGEWRVRALRIEGENDGPGMTLDFENPQAALLGAAFRAFGEGMGQMLKGFGEGMGAFLEGVEKGAALQKSKASGTSPVTEPSEPATEKGESVKIEERATGS